MWKTQPHGPGDTGTKFKEVEDMIASTLQSIFTDSKIVKATTVKVDVNLEPTKLLEAEAKEINRELLRLAPYTGYADVANLESDDILKYLKTLVWMRCHRVQYSRDKAYQPYRNLVKVVEVPVLPYQLLISIGKAYDRSFSIEFNPVYQIASEDLLAPEDMLNLSNILRSMRQIGFRSVTGIPEAEEGELDFMAMSHVGNVVTSYKESHPVYGFMASFFTQQQLNEVTGTMSRMIYGYDEDYRVMIGQIHQRMTENPPTERPDNDH
jgi:hypothetical protein